MKKIVILLSLFLIMFLMPTVKADTFEPVLTGDDVISVGENIEFTISLKTDLNVNKFETVVKYDSKILKFLNVSTDDNWTSSTINNSGELKFSNTSIKGETTVATLKFKVISNSTKGETTVTVDDLKLYSTDETPIIKTSEAISKTVRLRSDDNTIKNIKINDKLISGYNTTTYFYTLEVESIIEEIDIKAVVNDETATFLPNYGERKEELNYGANTVLIKVKSESGKELTYTLNIIRKDDRVVDNDLKTIILNGGKVKLNFDKSVLSYTVKTYKLDSITVEAETFDSEAKYEIDAPKKLIIGENYVTIKVTAVTGDVKNYKIIIINRDQPTDTRLKYLSVKGYSFEFDSNKCDYNIPYRDTFKRDFEVFKTAVSSDVEIDIIGTENIKPGSVIKIIVTAIDGSDENIYTITIGNDNRINFFCIIEVITLIILAILVIIQFKKKKKREEKIKQEEIEEELSKTKEIEL